MSALKAIWDGLISLIVDDGLLAIAALVAIGVTGLITRDWLLGPTNLAGWILFGLLVASVVISSRRAVERYEESP